MGWPRLFPQRVVARRAHSGWGAFALLASALAAQMAASALQQGIPVIAPFIRDQPGASAGWMAAILAASNVGICVTVYPWGRAADRFGAVRVTQTGLVIVALGLVLASRMTSAPALFLALVLAGAGAGGPIAAAGKSAVAALGLARLGLALGLRQMVVPVGLAAAAVGLPRVAVSGGVPAAFVALALFAGAAAVVGLPASSARIAVPRSAAPPSGSDRKPIGTVLVACGCLVALQWTFISYLPLYLHDERDWDLVAAGDLLMWLLLGSGLTRLLVGWWSDSRDRLDLTLMAAIGALGAALGATAAVSSGAGLELGALLVAAVVGSSWAGLAHGVVAGHVGQAVIGRGHGLLNTVLYGSGAFWAQAIPLCATHLGWMYAWLIAGTAGLVGSVLLLRVRRIDVVEPASESGGPRPPRFWRST